MAAQSAVGRGGVAAPGKRIYADDDRPPGRPLPHDPRKIIVLRPGRLGDLLLVMPAIRALKRSFPAAEVVLVAHDWASDLAARFPNLDRFLPFPGFPGMPGPCDRGRTAAFLRRCQDEGFDIVLQAQGWDPPATIFATLLGGHFVAGYCRDDDIASELDLCLPRLRGEHEIYRLLRLAGAVGATAHGTRLEFPITEADRAEVALHAELAAALATDRQLVGIHPGAGAPAKRWSPRRFAALADALAMDHGCAILLLGSPGDRQAMRHVHDAMRSRPVIQCEPLSLGGFAALVGRLDLYVGNDTGTSHLAVAVDTPSVAIFGPADAARWVPLDAGRHKAVSNRVACSPCDYAVCPIDHRCLASVSVTQVLSVAVPLLTGEGSRDDASVGC